MKMCIGYGKDSYFGDVTSYCLDRQSHTIDLTQVEEMHWPGRFLFPTTLQQE